jgi:hypothetical protein
VDLDVVWHAPVRLCQARANEHLIYAYDHWDAIRDAPGVYVLRPPLRQQRGADRYRQANELSTRIGQHIEGNIRLMQAINDRSGSTGRINGGVCP